MKKIIFILIASIGFGLIVNAQCINGNFTYKENGQTTAFINLKGNCTFTMKDHSNGFSATGTYEIEGQIASGGTNTIIFTIDGKQHEGKFFFPTQGKMGISFDGMYFESSLR